MLKRSSIDVTRKRLVAVQLLIGLVLMIACSTNHPSTDGSKTHLVSEATQSPSPLAASQGPSSLVGLVVAVIDGDTLEIRDPRQNVLRIQLQAIDAPEAQQPFGNVSRENLADLVVGKAVRFERYKRDDYGRLIAKVFSDDRDVGLEQLKAGLAWYYSQFANELNDIDQLSYSQAEQAARAQRLGLWRNPPYLEPWLFRNQSRYGFRTNKRYVSPTTSAIEGEVRGNRRSKIYHWPGCPNYDDIAPHNRVFFRTADEAERAGYRAARNCS